MLTCYSNLSASVAELGEGGVEESILLPEWFDSCVGMSLFCLEGHVRVRDLWYRRAEDASQQSILHALRAQLTSKKPLQAGNKSKRWQDRSIGRCATPVHFYRHQRKSHRSPSTGATTVPIPLKACEMLMRISEYRGGPQTVMYGFAAVSRDPSPLPMTKMAAQKPPKDLCRIHGQAINAPIA